MDPRLRERERERETNSLVLAVISMGKRSRCSGKGLMNPPGRWVCRRVDNRLRWWCSLAQDSRPKGTVALGSHRSGHVMSHSQSLVPQASQPSSRRQAAFFPSVASRAPPTTSRGLKPQRRAPWSRRARVFGNPRGARPVLLCTSCRSGCPVAPCPARALSAPASRSNFTTSGRPCAAARWSGVPPHRLGRARGRWGFGARLHGTAGIH